MGFLQRSRCKFQLWFFEGKKQSDPAQDSSTPHKQHSWWQVMCLTGVDYFSTLGYVPNAIAAFLLFLRNETGKLPHVYFGWSEGNPVSYLLKYIAFGEGDTAPVTHEVLRQAEKDPDQRPIVHVGG